MKKYFLLFLLLISQAQAADVFSRSDCEFDGDGTAYACAASGGATGAFNDLVYNPSTSMTASDTWYVCGSFTEDHRRNNTTMITSDQAGASDNPVFITGDCSQFGGSSRAILDGQSDTLSLDGILNSGVISYIHYTNFDVLNTERGIVWSSNTQSPIDVVVDNNTVTATTLGNCYVGSGQNLQFTNNRGVRCGNDGLNVPNGTGNKDTGTAYGYIGHNYFDQVSQNGSAGGDGIKIQECMNTTGTRFCSWTFEYNVIYKTGDNKNGILFTGLGNGATYRYNRVYGFSSTGSEGEGGVAFEEDSTGISLLGCGSTSTGTTSGLPDLIVEYNYIESFTRGGLSLGVTSDSNAGNCTVYFRGNVIRDISDSTNADGAIEMNLNMSASSNVYIYNNTLGVDGDVYKGITTSSVTAANLIQFWNNRVSSTSHYLDITSSAESNGWESDFNAFDGIEGANQFKNDTGVFSLNDWVINNTWDVNSFFTQSNYFTNSFDLGVAKITEDHDEFMAGANLLINYSGKDSNGCRYNVPPSIGADEVCH